MIMSLLRVSGLLLGATLFSTVMGQGCGCPDPDPPVDGGPQPGPTLAFAAFPDTVDCLEDDADPNTPGFQLELEVVIEDDDGSGYADVEINNSRGGAPGEGTFEDSRATVIVDVVADSEAPGAANTLTAESTNADGETISVSDTVNVICADTPAEAECHFAAPLDGDTVTTDPISVTVECSIASGVASADQNLLVLSGTVIVTADTESIEIVLGGGIGVEILDLPDGVSPLDLELELNDPNGLFPNPITDTITIDVNLDNGIPITAIDIVDDADDDGELNIADNGGVEEAGNVTSDVTVTFDAPVTGDVVGTTPAGSCTFAATAATTVTLPACPFAQGESVIIVTAPGVSTNSNFEPLNVDTVAPTVDISSPTEGQVLTGADDSDAAPGLQFDVVVTASLDSVDVQLQIDDAPGGNAAPDASGVALLEDETLPNGALSLTAIATDALGNTQTSAPRAVVVDAAGPDLDLTAPAAVDQGDDLDALLFGVQIDVSVTPTGLAAGEPIAIESSLDGSINEGVCNSAGDGVAVTCRVTLISDGVHDLTAIATDENDNVGVSDVVQVDATTGLVGVNIISPALRGGVRAIGAAEDTVAGGDAQVNVTGTTAPNTDLQLFIDGVFINLVPVSSDAAGNFTIPVTLPDGDTGSIEVRVVELGVQGSSGIDSYRVDIGRPTAVFTNPAGETATFAQAQDTSAAPGLQVSVSIAVTECENGVAQVREGTTVIGESSPLDAGGAGNAQVAVSDLTEGNNQTWTAQCVDAVGNTAAAPDTVTVTVDVTPPAAPTLTVVVDDVRQGIIDVRYTQPGDDGTTGNAATVAAFMNRDIAITDNDFGTGAQIALVVPDGSTAGGTVIGPDDVETPPNTLAFDTVWHVALRATDDVGNRSALATAQVNLATEQTALAPPGGVAGWAQTLSRTAGDINNDGFDDFVVGAPDQFSGGNGGFEVILGAATPGALSRTFIEPPATLACAAPPCTPLEAGWAVNIISSINGDAFDDVVVVSYDQNFNQEFVLIYAGSATGIAANATPAATLEGAFFTFAGFVSESVGDVDGDGDIDWALNSPGDASVYLFLNSGAFPASGGIAARATTRISDPAGNFGFGAGIAGVNGIGGDALDDIVITDTSAGNMYVVRGRAAWPATLVLGGGGALIDTLSLGEAGDQTPGADVVSGLFDGDDDLLDVAVKTDNAILTFRNTGTTFDNKLRFELSLSTSSFWGAIGVGDFNVDGRDDLAAGGTTPESVFFGAAALVDKAQDVLIETIFVDRTVASLLTVGANVVGDDDDLVMAISTAPGSVIIRH
jgi:hypothetical protein